MNFIALNKRILNLAVFFVFFALALVKSVDGEAKGLSFIHDAEIENTIRAYAAPLFKAAGLNPSAIKIYLVNDNTLNAFVAGGQKMFLNTGLLMQSKHAGQVIGVIAHETGHISGGHLSRVHDAMKTNSAQNILAMVLGGAAAVATGRADVGTAVWLGGASMSQRGLLQYSRTQEGAADQAALKLLDATKQSSRGFLEFTETLSDQELLSVKRQDPYLRTHPLTQNRINAMRAHVSKSRYSNARISPRFDEMHRRMLAKLRGFIESLTTTLRRYKETDNSLESRYARAVAYYRLPDLDKALPLINGLIAERPDDPYFHELKGQMLFENGRLKEALEPYVEAVRLLPNSALLRIGLARTQLESGDPDLLDSAIVNLRAAVLKRQDSPFTWRQLAIAYGRKGEMGLSSLAMAEEALLNGKKSNAIFHAGRAEKLLPHGSMGWMQAQDILQQANQGKKRPDK